MAGPSASRFGVALYGEDRQIPDDFAGVDAPKLKFNFTISFDYTDMLKGTTEGSDDPYQIDFGVKQITRPSPNVIYEDLNFYNFISKVATKVEFGVVTVTLYDDRSNKAHDIFQKYMEAISPITNVNRANAPLMDLYGQSTTGSIGPLDDNARHGPIKSIRVTHITSHLGSKVVYDFINPKIQNVVLDELDMTQSDVNTLTFTFIYDSYNVTREAGTKGTSPINLRAASEAEIAARTALVDLPIELQSLDEVVVTAERRGNAVDDEGIPPPPGSI